MNTLSTASRKPGLILLWLLFLASPLWGEKKANREFERIFDGKTLRGWRALPKESRSDWSARNGIIVGRGSVQRQSYLIWEDPDLADFELKLSYRMATKGNTGIELRSRVDTSGKRPLEGYHADLGHIGIGPQILGAWDFHFAKRREYPCHRGQRLVIAPDGAPKYTKIEGAVTLGDIKRQDWNAVHLIVRGNRCQFFINGKPASEFVDQSPQRLEKGFIGLQLHDKGMVVEYKDVLLKKY